jgi:hypothetical protein
MKFYLKFDIESKNIIIFIFKTYIKLNINKIHF